jgi:hypothetical protein
MESKLSIEIQLPLKLSRLSDDGQSTNYCTFHILQLLHYILQAPEISTDVLPTYQAAPELE